jgi:signal transduction histidine kinase
VAARVRRYDDVRLAERESLARELHDTVAHHVSAIVVQAQAGRAIAASRPEQVVDVLGAIEQAASDALGEMRALVGALRRDAPESASDPAPRQPQPGIHDLERLVAQPAGALTVRLELIGAVHALPAGIAAAVYRIAQESITNAARHATGATEVVVRVTAMRDHVEVLVRDDGVVRPGPRRDGGYGVRGMAERVALLGGRFDAGPSGPAPEARGAGDAGPSGPAPEARGAGDAGPSPQAEGWVVRATLPLAPTTEARR